MSQLFAWGGQSIGVSASTSVLPMNTQDWYPLEWTGWISLQSKGLSRVFFNTTVQNHQFFGAQPSSQFNSHIHIWPLEKTIALTRWTLVGKVMSLLLNMLTYWHLINCLGFVFVDLFSSPLLLFSCDLMTLVLCLDSFFFFVCIYFRFLVCGYHEVLTYHLYTDCFKLLVF